MNACRRAGNRCHPAPKSSMGPISTGLGEVFWWAVEYQQPERMRRSRDGKPGWQSDGSYLTPEGRVSRRFRAHGLPAHGAGLDHPAANARWCQASPAPMPIGGYVKQYQVAARSGETRSAYGLSFDDIVEAIEANNASRGASYVERNGEDYVVRAAGRIEDISRDRRDRRRHARGARCG